MKVKFRKLRDIDSAVGDLYRTTPTLKNSKFGYAYKRFAEKNYEKVLRGFQEAINDVRIDHALADEKTKEILLDHSNLRGYKYSKEGLKQVAKEENRVVDEWNEKEIEIEPHISTEVPEGLTEEMYDIFAGILIPEQTIQTSDKDFHNREE